MRRVPPAVLTLLLCPGEYRRSSEHDTDLWVGADCEALDVDGDCGVDLTDPETDTDSPAP